ncbi:MAG TPA: DUF5996 family protein [Nitrospirales bacterium]|nr:DUF5996 family protein [Nitrospirales bacterium]
MNEGWPALPVAEWSATYATLHMWTQIIGKIRLTQTPLCNHWWNTTLYVTSRGLTTSVMPYDDRTFQIDFDFIDHQLLVKASDGGTRTVRLRSCSVADFYQETMDALRSLGMPVTIWTTPVEVEERIPFEQDRKHAAYDPEYVQRVWRILLQASRVLTTFRSHFIGKSSPVHFFWGAFDLAVTRFSGRRAPVHAGAPNLARFVAVEAYSHEVSSVGFWPGGGVVDMPVFYAYAYPEPKGFQDHPIEPAEAFYHPVLREFVLPYDVVRTATSPDEVLLAFAQSTYEAAAILAKWDRDALERPAAHTWQARHAWYR